LSNDIEHDEENIEFSYSQWIITRDFYLDWLTNFLYVKKKDPIFIWRGFNLLYITLPAKKDIEIENKWFKKIILRINGYSKPDKVTLIPNHKFLFRFFILFLYEILKLFLIKYFIQLKKNKISKSDVYFHSLSSNLQNSKKKSYDRHFRYAPLFDVNFNQKATYAVTLVPSVYDIKHFFSYSKNTNKCLMSLGRDYILLNKFISFWDIINVYYSVFLKWKKFRKEATKQDFMNNFTIDNISFADILIKEIDKSFLGEIQWALIYGLSFKNWIKHDKIEVPILTYGETLSPMRPVYFFSKQENYKINFFSIQHSINNRNKIGLFHRKNDFETECINDSTNYLILPDYYLLQGIQFSELIKEFYPLSRTKIIGCLKYDGLNNFKDDEHIKFDLIKYKNSISGKVILIAPSVNDLAYLLTLFKRPIFSKWKIVIRPHPANNIEKVEELIKQANLSYNLDIITNYSTNDLFSIADLVVCGYSASCYEAIINNIPAVQFLNLFNMPLIEPDDDIPSFSNPNDFWDWFIKFDTMNLNIDFKNISERISTKYFYKVDGKSSERLWEYLIENKN
jgi:hypothetical protein